MSQDNKDIDCCTDAFAVTNSCTVLESCIRLVNKKVPLASVPALGIMRFAGTIIPPFNNAAEVLETTIMITSI